MNRIHPIVRTACLLGVFVFCVLGIRDINAAPDVVFDRFLSAGFFLVAFLWYERLTIAWPALLPAAFAIIIHALKLYGNTYLGIEFDMIMHSVAGFAVSLLIFQYLRACEGIGCMSVWKLGFFAVFAMAGLGTVIEITEYAGYSYLKPGDGILHFGAGDTGEWNDAVWDMISNLVGATIGAVLSMVLSWNRGVDKNILLSFIPQKYRCAFVRPRNAADKGTQDGPNPSSSAR